MRQIVAIQIKDRPADYNEAILGKPLDEYTDWILKESSWGGAIECQILAEYFGIMISVVDVQSGLITDFGEGIGAGQRMVLIYDGIHYDPLYLAGEKICG